MKSEFQMKYKHFDLRDENIFLDFFYFGFGFVVKSEHTENFIKNQD